MSTIKSYSVLNLGTGNVVTLTRYASNPKGPDSVIGDPVTVLQLPKHMFSTERVLLTQTLSVWSKSITDVPTLKAMISREFNKNRRTFLRDIYKADNAKILKHISVSEEVKDGKTFLKYSFNPDFFLEESEKPSVGTKTTPKPKAKESRSS